MHKELLAKNSPKDTKELPSILPFYEGMSLALYSKDCVRFGLMKPCECILEHIVFAPEEEIPEHALTGEPLVLKYMPVSLLLRAKEAIWSLSAQCLPKLPKNISRQGLFQLQPAQVFFRKRRKTAG